MDRKPRVTKRCLFNDLPPYWGFSFDGHNYWGYATLGEAIDAIVMLRQWLARR